MKYYPFPDNRIWKVGYGVFLALMLFLCRDCLFATAILGVNRAQFVTLGLVCLLGILFLWNRRQEWKAILSDQRLVIAAAMTVVLLLPMFGKRDWQMMYFSVLLCIYIAVFLTYFAACRDVAKYYVVLISLLGGYSILATYLLRIPVDSGLVSVPMFQNVMGVEFHNFGLAFVSDEFVKNRNFGIFREPGVHQYFIILALYLNNYKIEWKKQSHMWICNGVLALTMLTTFATGGVAELALLAVVVFFDKKLYKDKRIVIAVAVMILLGIVGLVFIVVQKGELYWELYGMIIYKFQPGADSGSERMQAILTDGAYFLQNPLFGETFSTVLHSVPNNTTSTMVFLAVFGLLGGALHVASWMALVWEKGQKLWVNLALLVILFLSFNTQNLITDVFFWLFPIMALTERIVPLLAAKKKG